MPKFQYVNFPDFNIIFLTFQKPESPSHKTLRFYNFQLLCIYILHLCRASEIAPGTPPMVQQGSSAHHVVSPSTTWRFARLSNPPLLQQSPQANMCGTLVRISLSTNIQCAASRLRRVGYSWSRRSAATCSRRAC